MIESKEDDTEGIQIGTCSEFKPGQKYATPSPGSGDRVFYETLLEQNPASEMAQDWCLSYGILETKAALSLYKTVCKRKGKPMTPTKSASAAQSPIKKAKVEIKKGAGNKKVKIIDELALTDTGFDGSSGWEGVGTGGI
jgi:hypothetical protein